MPLTLRTFALESAAMVGGLVATGILLRRLTGDDPPEDRAIRSLQESFGHSPDDGAQPRTERSVGARVGPDDGPQPRTDSSAPAGASGVVVEERAAADHPAPAGTGGVVAGREAELVDGLTHGLSWYSGVPQTIANGAAWCGVTWLATRDWRQSIAPGAALALETACFVGSAAIVGRPRPQRVWRPEAPHATGSYPSGHTAAAVALHTTLANLLARHGRGAWWSSFLLRYEVPADIAFSRVYRGQHHITDVVAGAVLGRWSAGVVRRALLD